jgi:4-amino-4-deoxy-L-arabinose transferase-like glycosyltransferase
MIFFILPTPCHCFLLLFVYFSAATEPMKKPYFLLLFANSKQIAR